MHADEQGTADRELDARLRAARPAALLPPGFSVGVWRRVEQAELAARVGPSWPWLERVVDLMIRPRIAVAGIAALILVSASAGFLASVTASRHDALLRYVASVSPPLEP